MAESHYTDQCWARDTVCYVCGNYPGYVEERANLWSKVAELVEAASLNIDNVNKIEISPDEVVFTILLEDEDGYKYIRGDRVASTEIVFPISQPAEVAA